MLTRWRYRLGFKLLAPLWLEQVRQVKARIDSGHQPTSYHKDWWQGQWFGLVGLYDRIHRKTFREGKGRPKV